LFKTSDTNFESPTLLESTFLKEIENIQHIKKEDVKLDESLLYESLQLHLANKPKPDIKLLDKKYIEKFLERFTLSATSLNKYLNCPISFYYEKVLAIPSGRTMSAGFGTAVHTALERCFRLMLRDEHKHFPPVQTFLDELEKALKDKHSHFTPKELKDAIEKGREKIAKYYEYYHNTWHRDVETEVTIQHNYFENIPLSGNIDKIEKFDDHIQVIDYKTGKPNHYSLSKLNPIDTEKDFIGGDYWRQLYFYKILIDYSTKNYPVLKKGVIDFVEISDEQKFVKKEIIFMDKHLEEVKQQIRNTYKSIMNMEFSKGCGKEDCKWCNFTQQNPKVLISIPANEEIEEDSNLTLI
jgi:DNA helicase-2/ATP-dependent DNA helicase PcrA